MGSKFRRAHQAAGLSQEALADKADLHRNTIPPLENDQAEPRLNRILALARALDIDPCDLLKGLGGRITSSGGEGY
jgi:transcriptional regulator with XRE-family HTH domain